MVPIRILYVNGGPLNRGGIESYMMNYYRNFDRSKVQIDFVSIGMKKAAYDEEIEHLGGKIYYIPKKSKNYIKYKKELRKIFKMNDYKIVHTHMDAMGMTVLKEAEKCNVPIRIAHSHNTQHLTSNFFKLRINEFARKNINKYATHMFACSEKAGRWLFGDECFENGEVKLINNAIEINKFLYDDTKRKELRNKFNISNNDIVIGHVGRFDEQKNHKFLISIFKKLIDIDDSYKLILIGDGHLKFNIKEMVKEFNIENKVIFISSCDNVNEFYNMFDIFILPSLFEGLGIVAIEAQVNGLSCVLSDTIPREVKISNNIKFISLNDEGMWINSIKSCDIQNRDRYMNYELFTRSGYDIKIESKKLQETYLLLNEEI